VQLHTHLAETQDEEDFCIEMFGHRPVAYMQEVNWIGKDVWFAHSVHVNHDEIQLYADTGCGIAHCPGSNMRLGSGIAPILEMLSKGVDVGIGVDGSASNDSSHLLGEARLAMLLSRVGAGLSGASRSNEDAPPLMSARQALEMATRGGARVLGREDIGSLEVGKCADLIAIDLNRVDYAGALHDPVAAALFCSPQKVDLNIVGGKIIVKDGQMTNLDVDQLVKKHNQAAQRLLNG
jgi:cytosine/adenosine deaminase-related metal-dependent hydrolase